jgi:5-methylcytosine-specific restriction protein A
MAKRPCARPGCRNLVARGYCDACAPKHSLQARTEAARPSAHKRGYTRRWAAYSKDRLRRFAVCADPYKRHGVRIVPAVLTDHVRAHKGDMELFWDTENHQSLCEECHDVKTATEDGGFGRLLTRNPQG